MAFLDVYKNSLDTMPYICNDLKDHFYRKIFPSPNQYSLEELESAAQLKKNGFLMIENFWPKDIVEKIRGHLEQCLLPENSHEIRNGAYVRYWDHKPRDSGIRRIYHAELVAPELIKFRFDPFILRVVQCYYDQRFYSGVLVFQHSILANNNPRAYHFDWYSKEFKAILYLQDIAIENGPFSFIKGSQRKYFFRLKRQLLGNKKGGPRSFELNELGELLKHEVKLTAPAGTLILTDGLGLHRAAPQDGRSRSILLNFMYPHPGDPKLEL